MNITKEELDAFRNATYGAEADILQLSDAIDNRNSRGVYDARKDHAANIERIKQTLNDIQTRKGKV